MKKYFTTYETGTFGQKTRKILTEKDCIEGTVTAIAAGEKGCLLAAADNGIYRLTEKGFIKIEETDTGAAVLYENGNMLYAAFGNTLVRYKNNKIFSSKEFSSPVTDIKAGEDGALWILTETVLYKETTENNYEIKIGIPGKASSLAAYKDGRVYVGTYDNGLYSLVGKRWHWCELQTGTTGILSNAVNCVYVDSTGNIWAGTDKGISVYDDNSYWLDSRTIPSLPSLNINAIAADKNGNKYFATTKCLVHLHNGRLSYYGYKRFLPDPDAKKLVVSPDGTVYILTSKGLVEFRTEEMTLEEKAIKLRENTEKYCVRKDGYVLSRMLENEGIVDENEGHVGISDNDGLNTGLYTAALCFEYACTKNEEVRKMAQRSLKAMIKLVDITGIEGFAARAIRYADEPEYGSGNRQEWHVKNDENGNELEWKGETSSDEMVGHFYCYANYYDLAANDEDKKLIENTVRKILDHILGNNFRLVDTDGKPTTWANWNPDLLNNDNKWVFEKGTNSLQILTFLKIGYHITHDEKYEEMFRHLASDKHYAMNLMQYRILDNHLCHIDDNHDFLMISLLMKYTDDEELRSIFAMGLDYHWQDEKDERNALFNFIYGACTGERFNAEDAIDELADYPMDQIAWPIYNSYRPDLDWDMRPAELGMIPQLYYPLSAHERRITSNDINRFIVDSGAADVIGEAAVKSSDPTAFNVLPPTGDDRGMELYACTNFTHPYWYARYYGLIK